jgi:histone chaperone ASF1
MTNYWRVYLLGLSMWETIVLCYRQSSLAPFSAFFYCIFAFDLHIESILIYHFVGHLQADPPDPSKIREEDIIGVTVLLLTCSYLGQEFIRVGYYVNNDYDDEQLREEPPPKVLIDKVQRNILSDKPRVTKFPINFHPEDSESREQPPPPDHPSETDGNGEELPVSPDYHPSEEQRP